MQNVDPIPIRVYVTKPTVIPSAKERNPELEYSLKNLIERKTAMGIKKYPKIRLRLVGSG
jgi:hypothetical protein